MSRPPLPPFTRKTAVQKVRIAEDAWNSRDHERVALAYTEDSRWRNRSEFLEGRPAIVAFLTRKWQRELEYRLAKDLWAFARNFIAVRFQYEWALCQRTSVSGRMIVRTDRIDGNQRYSWIKNQRSWFVSRMRPRSLRRKTINCCRSTAFSASSRNFDLNGEARTATTKQSSPIIPPA